MVLCTVEQTCRRRQHKSNQSRHAIMTNEHLQPFLLLPEHVAASIAAGTFCIGASPLGPKLIKSGRCIHRWRGNWRVRVTCVTGYVLSVCTARHTIQVGRTRTFGSPSAIYMRRCVSDRQFHCFHWTLCTVAHRASASSRLCRCVRSGPWFRP